MKKVVLFSLLAMLLAACNSDRLEVADGQKSSKPATRVFVQGQLISSAATKGDYRWPYVSDEGWETARFSIRADNTAPDYLDHSSDLYYGRRPGVNGKNRGRVATNYPYGHYNDRDFDYTKRDRKTGNNIGLFRYVFDTKGLKTQLAILEAPKVRDILDDEVIDLEKAIASGKNVAANTEKLDGVNAILAHSDEYLESHVLWYVVKEVGMMNGWHVNGIISENVVGEPDNIPDNVEVDIHQQKHADWAEIKTSVHVRTDAGFVEINIPLEEADIVEDEDFDVRIYQDYFSGDEARVKATVTISHNEAGITILISDIDNAQIEQYKASFGDGLTVEIHSFCTLDNPEEIWSKVSKSIVVRTGKPVTVVGQITSALFEDSYPVRIMHP